MSLQERLEKEISILREKVEKWRESLTPEEKENIRSIINQIQDDSTKLIVKKILFENG